MGCSYLRSCSGWLFGYHRSPASLLYECLSMLIFLFCTDTVWSVWTRVCGRASEVCRNPDPFLSYLNREICMYAWTWTRTWIRTMDHNHMADTRQCHSRAFKSDYVQSLTGSGNSLLQDHCRVVLRASPRLYCGLRLFIRHDQRAYS